MTLEDFRQSLTATERPAGLTHALAGLWWDAKNDWERGSCAENLFRTRLGGLWQNQRTRTRAKRPLNS